MLAYMPYFQASHLHHRPTTPPTNRHLHTNTQPVRPPARLALSPAQPSQYRPRSPANIARPRHERTVYMYGEKRLLSDVLRTHRVQPKMTFTTKIAFAAATLFATADAQAAGPCTAERATCMGDEVMACMQGNSTACTTCLGILMSGQASCPGTPDDAAVPCAVNYGAMTCNADNTACTQGPDLGTCAGGTGCIYTAGASGTEMNTACAANTDCNAMMVCNCADDPTCGGDANCPCDAAPAPADASGAERIAPAVVLAFAALMASN